jgi:hypothetical protein
LSLQYGLDISLQFDAGNPGLVTALQTLNSKVHTRPRNFEIRIAAGMGFTKAHNVANI